ncbi:MAG: type II toxin-antitoxin system RelE/ParE family toxin [Candidatus Binatia bacterium]
MDREVAWTDSAADDLDLIGEYIAADSPDRAASVIRDLVAAGGSLARFADRGRSVPEYGEPTIRELFVHGYRLIYQAASRVLVPRVIHGARELPRARPSS